jgi:hypothetical protein
LLLEREGASGDGDVVIGGKESDQAEGNAATGLGEPEVVETEEVKAPWAGCCWQVWRSRWLLAEGWRIGGAWEGWGHGAGAAIGAWAPQAQFHRRRRMSQPPPSSSEGR